MRLCGGGIPAPLLPDAPLLLILPDFNLFRRKVWTVGQGEGGCGGVVKEIT